jgi:hypothetical protein
LQGFANDSNNWFIEKVTIVANNPELKDKLWVNVDALQKWIEERFNIGDTNTCVLQFILKVLFRSNDYGK